MRKRSQKINYNVILHYISLSKILPHSKTIKSFKKLSVFGENGSRRLSIFLQTHIFRNFVHISRINNQINYRNIWFPKVIKILIMTTQMLFFNVFFSEKDPLLNTAEIRKLKIHAYCVFIIFLRAMYRKKLLIASFIEHRAHRPV